MACCIVLFDARRHKKFHAAEERKTKERCEEGHIRRWAYNTAGQYSSLQTCEVAHPLYEPMTGRSPNFTGGSIFGADKRATS